MRRNDPAASSTKSGVRYFVRDDDVGELTDALRGFVETFLEREIQVSYQIIPSRLTADCADYLLAHEREHPGLVEFGQHGLHHQMKLGGRLLLREFGPERTLDQQQADIDQGLRLLKSRLGADRQVHVFTPPQHKYDRSTVKAAAAAGHRIFSASSYPTLHHQLAYAAGRTLGLSSFGPQGVSHHGARRPEADITELSISIDVDDGRALRYPAAGLADAVRRAAARTGRVGLMFHHAIYAERNARSELSSIADHLASYGPGNFYRLSSLADGPSRD